MSITIDVEIKSHAVSPEFTVDGVIAPPQISIDGDRFPARNGEVPSRYKGAPKSPNFFDGNL
jgi:hypothetical protein